MLSALGDNQRILVTIRPNYLGTLKVYEPLFVSWRKMVQNSYFGVIQNSYFGILGSQPLKSRIPSCWGLSKDVFYNCLLAFLSHQSVHDVLKKGLWIALCSFWCWALILLRLGWSYIFVEEINGWLESGLNWISCLRKREFPLLIFWEDLNLKLS